MVPMMAATATATLVAFHVDGYSIYSARLGGTPLARLSGLARRGAPADQHGLAGRAPVAA